MTAVARPADVEPGDGGSQVAAERRRRRPFAPSTAFMACLPSHRVLWQSILAPIYLQLFEALRRITEGEPGAAICRECGRPFLVLDARRRFFCSAREQFRHSKREQRKRIAVEDSVTLTDAATIEITRGDLGR